MKLTGIVAMTSERLIGKDGGLPWHLPEDLKFFKKQTTGHPILMGRKTFESIGRALPNRQNIVLTSDPHWQHEGVDAITDPKQLEGLSLMNPQIYIIGGAQIYALFMPLMDDLIVTHVHASYEGDTYLPDFTQEFPNSELISEQEDFTITRHFR